MATTLAAKSAATSDGDARIKIQSWKRRFQSPMFWVGWRSHVGHQWRFEEGLVDAGRRAASALDDRRRTDAAPV
jgi:hypothetical protein